MIKITLGCCQCVPWHFDGARPAMVPTMKHDEITTYACERDHLHTVQVRVHVTPASEMKGA